MAFTTHRLHIDELTRARVPYHQHEHTSVLQKYVSAKPPCSAGTSRPRNSPTSLPCMRPGRLHYQLDLPARSCIPERSEGIIRECRRICFRLMTCATAKSTAVHASGAHRPGKWRLGAYIPAEGGTCVRRCLAWLYGGDSCIVHSMELCEFCALMIMVSWLY